MGRWWPRSTRRYRVRMSSSRRAAIRTGRPTTTWTSAGCGRTRVSGRSMTSRAPWRTTRTGSAGTIASLSSTLTEADMTTLDDEARTLFAGPNIAHIATLLPDGSPHSVPVMIDIEDDHLAFFTSPRSRKGRNLAADDRVAIS